MAASAYNERGYKRYKKRLAEVNVQCWRSGCTNRATSPDHDPPLKLHTHITDSGCCTLHPACMTHQSSQGAQMVNARRASGYSW